MGTNRNDAVTASAHSLPLPVRLMNLAGKGARLIGLQPIRLSVDSLLENASAKTGLTDFGGDEFREPLGLLIESLEGEAKLSLLGRLVARGDLLRTLENRLPSSRSRPRSSSSARRGPERPSFTTCSPWIPISGCR